MLHTHEYILSVWLSIWQVFCVKSSLSLTTFFVARRKCDLIFKDWERFWRILMCHFTTFKVIEKHPSIFWYCDNFFGTGVEHLYKSDAAEARTNIYILRQSNLLQFFLKTKIKDPKLRIWQSFGLPKACFNYVFYKEHWWALITRSQQMCEL